MNQRHVLGLVALILVVGVVTTAINQFKSSSQNISQSGQSSLFPTQPAGNQAAPVTPTPTLPPKQYAKFPGVLAAKELENKKAVIETTKGKIEFEIYPEASKSASNFIFLANDHFYDNLTFHRVEPGFVIQGGDPKGDGSGGPGYTFKEDKIVGGKYQQGIVAMAKRADEPAGSGGSQFFIMLKDVPLPLEYAIFGKIITGMDVVEKITPGDVMQQVLIENIK